MMVSFKYFPGASVSMSAVFTSIPLTRGYTKLLKNDKGGGLAF